MEEKQNKTNKKPKNQTSHEKQNKTKKNHAKPKQQNQNKQITTTKTFMYYWS